MPPSGLRIPSGPGETVKPPCFMSSLARHDDRGAGAARLREVAPGAEVHRQAAPFASDDGAIPTGSIERAVELPATRAAAPASVTQLARVARGGHAPGGSKCFRGAHVRSQVEEHRERVSGSRPVHARLHRRSRRDPYGPRAASTLSTGQPKHRPDEGLAYDEYVRLGEKQLEGFPVLLVRERENVRSYRLTDVPAKGPPVPPRDAPSRREAAEVRPHHHRHDCDRYAQAAAALRLRVHQIPVSRAPLRVLFFPRRVVERELQIVESSNFVVAQQRDAEAIRRHGKLHVAAPQQRQHLAKLRMQAVLTGAEIDGVHRERVNDGSNLLDVEAIRARRVPVTERAGEVAFVRETEPQRKPRRCAGRTWWSSAFHRAP